MPEIWLNYGVTDVVLDIRAENLEQKIDSDGKILDDSAINEKLSSTIVDANGLIIEMHTCTNIASPPRGVGLLREFCSEGPSKEIARPPLDDFAQRGSSKRIARPRGEDFAQQQLSK